MAKATTIPRNHAKKIEAVKAEITRARVYNGAGYAAEDVDPAVAWSEYESNPAAKLKKIHFGGRTTYKIEVHAGRWFTLVAA